MYMRVYRGLKIKSYKVNEKSRNMYEEMKVVNPEIKMHVLKSN